jgi:hypothetical protein
MPAGTIRLPSGRSSGSTPGAVAPPLVTVQSLEAKLELLVVLSYAAPDPDQDWAFGRMAQGWRVGGIRLVVRNRRVVTILPPVAA